MAQFAAYFPVDVINTMTKAIIEGFIFQRTKSPLQQEIICGLEQQVLISNKANPSNILPPARSHLILPSHQLGTKNPNIYETYEGHFMQTTTPRLKTLGES